ncbi:uncharacterized protein LOC134767657 [Penaeus indicus]|uniref:uncharacterized protein LOC134767657 n=1 Tax=Penaeus indicus TaxID=29960 RepID=UPI00300D4369
MGNEYEVKVLLWSVTCGVALILGLMVTITCLLLRQNKLLKKRRSATSVPPPRSGRPKSRHRQTKRDEEGYLTPTGLPPPVSVNRFGLVEQPARPKGKRVPMQPPVLEDSPSSSLEKHIYEDADFGYAFEPDSESF